MVEQLIEAEVDVNLADEHGKTALHWAASVNNVEAVNVLLAHGANRDAQDNKDETPLFLAAREGSYQAARALLDHCANRDIQDHMDRLPIHVAHELMHQDIVQLLDEHIPPAPPMNASLHSLSASAGHNLGSSPQGGPQMNNLMTGSQPLIGTKPRPKKRTKGNSPNQTQNMMMDETPNASMNGTMSKNSISAARKPSFKRKKGDLDMMSPDNSPYNDHNHMNHHGQMQCNNGNGALTMSHPNFEDLISIGKQPPSYEAAVTSQQQHNNVARSMQSLQGGMPGQQNLKAQYTGFMEGQHSQQQQQQQALHNRQQSMPASVSSYSSHLSPPHSNMSHHHLQSPPPQNNSMSPPNHGIMMSPPQSVQSNHTMSPPSHHVSQRMSPPQHHQQQQALSPAAKSAARSIQLPTSPTHMAAMRGATHQKIQSFDFPCNDPNIGVQYANQQQQFLYPNPNGIHSDGFLMEGGVNSFMTPSPDSPGQWSPQSHSDWSDGILSPPATNLSNYHLQQQQMTQHQLQQTQQTEGVLI